MRGVDGRVEQAQHRAVRGAVAWNVAEINQAEVGQAFFELGQPRHDKFLALLGHVVLGIFTEIAQSHRALQLRRQLDRELMLQLLDFTEKFFLNFKRHGIRRTKLYEIPGAGTHGPASE